MRYIETFREGMHVSDVYLCKNKQIQLTKNGKEYGNLVLQDKTGTIDAKIWDLNSPGVGDFDTMASKLFISAKEVAKELEVSDSYAYRLIRQLNAELEQKGFVVVKGKISRKYFEERVYGMNEMK